MKETYINPKTKEKIVLDSNDPAFEKKRANLESRGYEWERGEPDRNVDSIDFTVSGQGDYKKRQAPLSPNVQSIPGQSYQTPAQPRPESGLGADSEFLQKFREQASTQTVAPTAIPDRTIPGRYIDPNKPVTKEPYVDRTIPGRYVPPPSAQVDPSVGLPGPSPTPTIAPFPAPQQGNTGFERVKTGLPPDTTDSSLITPVPGFEYDKSLDEMTKPSEVQLGEQLVDPTQSAAGPDNFEALKDPTKSLAEAASRIGAGDVTPEALKIEAPVDTKAMQNSGINRFTVPQTSAAVPQQDPLKVDYSANGKRTLGETDLPDFPGKLPGNATDTLPKSPFEGGVDNVGDTIPAGEPEVGSAPSSPVDGASGVARPQGSLGGMSPSELAARPATAEGGLEAIPKSPFGDTPATAEGSASATPSGMPEQTTKPSTSIGGNSPMEGFAPLGFGDTSGLQKAEERGQKAWNEYDPAFQAEANLARNTAANESRLGVGDIEKRMREVDEARYSRAADLAKARGVALEEYMQGLNSNEKKAFITTIVDSLGKILVGGFDIMTGPKTAAVSQYYKGITPYDKAGDDKIEKEKFDQKVKMVTDNEEDLREAEANWMQSKQILENLRGKVNQDVFKMAMEMMETTKKAYQQGFDVSHITAGYLSMLKDARQFEWAKMLAEFNAQLQRSILDATTSSKNASTMAEGMAKRTEAQTQEKAKENTQGQVNKKTFNADRAAQTVAAMEVGSQWYQTGLERARTDRRYNDAVSESMDAWKMYKADPSTANLEAYLNSLRKSDAIAKNTFIGSTNAMGGMEKINGMMAVVRRYTDLVTSDENHPYLTKGPIEGAADMGSYARLQAEKASRNESAPLFPVSFEGTDSTGEKRTDSESRKATEAVNVPRDPAPSTQPSEAPTATPTPATTGTPTKAPGKPPNWPPTSEPQQSSMTPTNAPTQSKPQPLTTPQTQSTPPPKKGLFDTVSGAVSSIVNEGTKPLRDDAAAKEIADIEKGLAVFAAKGKAKTITPEEKAEANRLIARYKEIMKAQNR